MRFIKFTEMGETHVHCFPGETREYNYPDRVVYINPDNVDEISPSEHGCSVRSDGKWANLTESAEEVMAKLGAQEDN